MKTKMNHGKKLLLAGVALVSSIAITNNVIPATLSKDDNARTVVYQDNAKFAEANFDAFDEHEIVKTQRGYDFKAKKSFNKSLLDGLDLVSVQDEKEEFDVNYEVNYLEDEDTVLLTVTLVGEDNVPVIDTLPGLITRNNAGESDVLFEIDGEIVWLSDLQESMSINETGWFKNLCKKIIDTVVTVVSAVVEVIKPIIKPVVDFCINIAYSVLGEELCAKLGATVLMMECDSKGVYHAKFDCWQAIGGYADLYDQVFDAATSMRPYKTELDTNSDGATDYILWGWKGDYLNLGAGCELGIYKKWDYSDLIWKVAKEEAMDMSIDLSLNNENIITWSAHHWWITGFNPAKKRVNRDQLRANFTVNFTNNTLLNALNYAVGHNNNYKANWTISGNVAKLSF